MSSSPSHPDLPTVAGKTIIVTGAAGGIGAHIVEILLANHCKVVAADLQLRPLEDMASRLPHADKMYFPMELDVRSEESWRAVLDKADGLGSFYGLVNGAGVLRPGYIADTKPEDIRFHMDINAYGLMLGSQMAARYFRDRKDGHIINIASLAGVAPIPGIALYSASKFAVRGFTLALAQEMAEHHVAVTVVCPDAVKTPMLDLQADYEEAALTFSGGDPLEPRKVAEATARCFVTREWEVLIPPFRGALAKLGSFSPDLARLLAGNLRKAGLAAQKKYEK